jgi:hypothetical protein
MERKQESLTTRDLAPGEAAMAHGEAEAAPGGTDVPEGAQVVGSPGAREVDSRRGDGGGMERAGDGVETERAVEPAGDAAAGRGAVPGSGGLENGDTEPLMTDEMSTGFQRRWEEVQTRFVDQPRGAVEEADSLVANVMQQLAENFAQERERLEAQWARGEDISTEDLRVALQRYRSFFRRLLST